MELTNKELEFFKSEGYLRLRSVLSHAELDPLVNEINDEIDRLADMLVEKGELSQTYRERPFEQRLGFINRESRYVFNSIKAGKLCGPGVFAMITNPHLLDIAEQLCGPELIASSVYRLRPKLPGEDSGCIPWHQDSAYFEPSCDQKLIVTCWIPLVDATEERGCLWILPRAHQSGVLKHSPHPGKVFIEIQQANLPYRDAICVPVAKGDVLIMTNTTPHASFANLSETIRWSIDIRYQSAALPTNAYVASAGAGSDGLGASNQPAACYPPESDFLVRSRKRPTDVCESPEDFRKLRQSHEPQPVTDRWNLSALGTGWHGYSETYKVRPS